MHSMRQPSRSGSVHHKRAQGRRSQPESGRTRGTMMSDVAIYHLHPANARWSTRTPWLVSRVRSTGALYTRRPCVHPTGRRWRVPLPAAPVPAPARPARRRDAHRPAAGGPRHRGRAALAPEPGPPPGQSLPVPIVACRVRIMACTRSASTGIAGVLGSDTPERLSDGLLGLCQVVQLQIGPGQHRQEDRHVELLQAGAVEQWHEAVTGSAGCPSRIANSARVRAAWRNICLSPAAWQGRWLPPPGNGLLHATVPRPDISCPTDHHIAKPH